MKHFIIAIASCLLVPMFATAQVEGYQLPVFRDAEQIVNPFCGGTNNPQLSEADLDLDGINELVIFDRSSNISSPFRWDAVVTGKYVFAPDLVKQIPPMQEFALFRDYNADGLMDIFTRDISGIVVYTGVNNNGKLYFQRYDFKFGEEDVLYYHSGNIAINIQVNKDIPDINDLDGDGDMDILNFESSGGYVHMYQNMAKEKGYSLDSMYFILGNSCWGRFEEPGNHNTLNLSPTADKCYPGLTDLFPRHAGSTLLSLDLNNDGARELLLGDLSYPNIVAAYNGGTISNPYMTSQDTTFPEYDHPVRIPVFPAGYHIDADRDGLKDLVFAPNFPGSEDRNPMWFYKNVTGNQFPEFALTDSTFLSSDMIDLGTGSHPAFADVNADGLVDMILAQGERFIWGGGAHEASLHLYLNTGTLTAPAFTLSSTDWADLKQYSLCNDCYTYYTPTFGDLDLDGDLDLLVGERYGSLLYKENIAGAGNAMLFAPVVLDWQGIDVGENSNPYIYDMNQDGLPDLVVGERSGGYINYFQNQGSAGNFVFDKNPDVTPNTSQLGKINIFEENQGSSAPVIFKEGETIKILVGSAFKNMSVYKVDPNDLSGTFELMDPFYGQIEAGDRVQPAIADLDTDGYYDLLCGNFSGGFRLYKTDLKSGLSFVKQVSFIPMEVFPNPGSDYINVRGIEWTGNDYWTIYNNLGQVIKSGLMPLDGKLSISNLAEGYYTIQLLTNNKQGSTSFIKLRN